MLRHEQRRDAGGGARGGVVPARDRGDGIGPYRPAVGGAASPGADERGRACAHAREAASAAVTQRMLVEAQALARLEHPAIVRVLDFGTIAESQPFVVMELLEGEDLKRLLERRGSLADIEAVRLMLPLFDGPAWATPRATALRAWGCRARARKPAAGMAVTASVHARRAPTSPPAAEPVAPPRG